ncbi:hypothetical protein QQ045_032060 [Rhodiola kirilowii]
MMKIKLGFDNCFAVDRQGLSGGLAVLWNSDTDLEIISYSKFHVDAVVKDTEEFRLTLFYGEPVNSYRWRSWDLLRRLSLRSALPWVVIGDFNEVVSSDEVWGGVGRPNWQMHKFRLALEDCNLSDLGFQGYQYTFSNRRRGSCEMRARLDRAVGNNLWIQQHPNSQVHHISSHASDHSIILLDSAGCTHGRRNRLFRFEAMWLDHEEFSGKMDEFWNQMEGLQVCWSERLQRCKGMIKQWNSSSFGDVKTKIKCIKQKLEVIKSSERSDEAVEEEARLSNELDQWLLREEILWMQRSRVTWLNSGDKNTKFFHARANQRRKKNWLRELRDIHGTKFSEPDKLTEIASEYFDNMFTSSLTDGPMDWERLLWCVKPVVTEEMNCMLMGDVREDEVRSAIFSMGPLKAPGIDGFPALFYQKNWSRLRGHVMEMIRRFWMDGVLDDRINNTLIVLLPKKHNADKMADLRPISLCTVAVKIITKVLAARLQGILNQVISCCQSAFIKGRIITDNFTVAHETSHILKSCKSRKDFYAFVKVDMSKAYDRVEWSFLEMLMRRMGFASTWVNRIMLCVRSVTYQVKVNDHISRRIFPERGLRQGDPLSPSLFLFCSELLSSLLNAGVAQHTITGMKFGMSGPVVTHLFFADDSIFFIKANAEEAEALKNTLVQFERASGQRVNLEKSEIVFSRNTPIDIQQRVAAVLMVRQVPSHSKYLGLPLVVGQRKVEVFNSIVEKVWNKINDWKNKFLSMAGREVLIKAVLQSLSVYMMSVYHFPQKTLDAIARLIGQFWWVKEGRKGVSWIRKEVLQRKKEDGGIGFKDLKLFNEAILMKICWRILTQPQLLVSRVLRAKYCGNGNLFDARMGCRPSHIWRGVMRNLNFFLVGVEWREDRGNFFWKFTSNGLFSVKSAYEVLMRRTAERNLVGEPSNVMMGRKFWASVWKCRVPNKIKIFCWRLFHESLPDARNLIRRGVAVESWCKICGAAGESAFHVVNDCWWAKAMRAALDL